MILSETTPCIEKEKLEKEKSNGLDELNPATMKSLGGSLSCDRVVGAFPHLFKETLNKHQGNITAVVKICQTLYSLIRGQAVPAPELSLYLCNILGSKQHVFSDKLCTTKRV